MTSQENRSGWPEDVKGVTLDQLDRLGIHRKDNRLYWDGKELVSSLSDFGVMDLHGVVGQGNGVAMPWSVRIGRDFRSMAGMGPVCLPGWAPCGAL